MRGGRWIDVGGERKVGQVKWYSTEKGYGFISQADGPDVFVHYSAVENVCGTLARDDRVTFEIGPAPQGGRLQAVNLALA
jgi:cold shock protein